MENPLLIDQLIQAVIDNDPKLVNELLNEGLNPNSCLDTALVTPLHHAAQNDSLEVIPLLVEAGADLDAETEPDGYTPLDIALLHEHSKVAQLLMAYSSGTDIRRH